MSEMTARGASAESRSAAIDLVKGMAIVAVICLHTFSLGTLHEVAALFHIWQAVPVFLFLFGLNAASSLRRRGGGTLRELYSHDYLAGRLDRVYVPFLMAFAVTLVVALLAGRAHFGRGAVVGDLVTGLFPVDGPGNYFVTLLFELTLVFPLVFWGLRRRPLPTLLLCLALDGTYEVMKSHLSFVAANPYLDVSFFGRFLFLVALGGFCAGVGPSRALRSRWLWCTVPFSVAYLVLAEADPQALTSAHLSQLVGPLLLATYPACLVLVGIALLPAVAPATGAGPVTRAGALLGRASYHVFLVQIAWFGLAVGHAHSLLALLGNLAVTLPLGVAFYELMEWVPLPSAAGLLARRRRQATPAEACP